ncbi:ABC transporter permease [Arthrobacter sp. NicSoilE8]|nr:ABC transporter permease [Arthrobacter sp. NicSoilE8]
MNTSTLASPVTAPDPGHQGRLAGLLKHQTTPIFIAFVLVCAALVLMTGSFATPRNFSNIMVQASIVGIAAVGATFIIITGVIDLSVGAVVGLAGMVGAQLVHAGMDPILGLLVTIAFAMLCGAFNGASVAFLKITPFIVTLALLGMAQGLTLQLSQGESVYDLPKALTWLGGGTIAGLPVPVPLTFVVFAIGAFVLNRTTFGHKVFAVGGNKEAARLAGINYRRVIFWVYAIAGACAGLSAVVLVGRLGSATPTAGLGLELQVIAAVVIGGTSLFGGKGSLFGTLIGVLFIAVVNNGLTLLNVNPYWIQIVQGAIIFVAVLMDSINSGRLRQDA